jgi:hypothetical protein
LESRETRPYALAFEQCKKAYLGAAAGTGTELELHKGFNQTVRSGIGAQLPPDVSAKLEKAYQDCEKKLNSPDSIYTYKQMKIDMLKSIRKIIRDGNEIPVQTAVETTTITDISPDGSPLSVTPFTTTAPTGHEMLPSSTGISPGAPHGDTRLAIAAIAISPLSAPPHLAFLNGFPVEWRSRPAWAQVIASMDVYLTSFDSYQGSAQRSLLASNAKSLVEVVESISLYTSLPADEAAKVAYQREIVNIAMSRPFNGSINRQVLGCETSRMMESAQARMPGNQLSLAMRAPILTAKNEVRHPVILSVSAPALDTSEQPEWAHYVKDGQFDVKAYRSSFQALAGHIRECAAAHPKAEVVLSGFGLANFLGNLPPADREKAKAVGAEVFIDLIRELRGKGIAVAYTDYSGTSPPWPAVNHALGNNKIACRGSIPGDWIKDEQIIVNAWDPHALVGNGCVNDQSLDGYIGRNSLVHEAHALACMLHAHGFKTLADAAS